MFGDELLLLIHTIRYPDPLSKFLLANQLHPCRCLAALKTPQQGAHVFGIGEDARTPQVPAIRSAGPQSLTAKKAKTSEEKMNNVSPLWIAGHRKGVSCLCHQATHHWTEANAEWCPPWDGHGEQNSHLSDVRCTSSPSQHESSVQHCGTMI